MGQNMQIGSFNAESIYSIQLVCYISPLQATHGVGLELKRSGMCFIVTVVALHALLCCNIPSYTDTPLQKEPIGI